MKRLPFARKNKTEIVPVGDDSTGIIYLLKRNARTVFERTSLDEIELQQGRGQLVLYKLAIRIGEEKGISKDEALALVLGGGDSPILLDYLDEMEELLKLRQVADRLKEAVATTMINGRIAYPLTVAKNAKAGEEKLKIEPLTFPLNDGETIDFSGTKITVVGFHECGASEIATTCLPANIAARMVGFWCDFESGQPKCGDNCWTSVDTNSLDESLIEVIYEFYQIEANGGHPAPGNEMTVDSLASSADSKNSVALNASTGDDSTGESPVIHSVTTVSAA